MNPFNFVLSQFPAVPTGDLEIAAIAAVMQLMGEAYSSGFNRGAGNNEFDYVNRQVAAKFGAGHPVSMKVAQLFADKLGR